MSSIVKPKVAKSGRCIWIMEGGNRPGEFCGACASGRNAKYCGKHIAIIKKREDAKHQKELEKEEEEKFVSLHGISSVEFARRIRVKQEEEKKKKDDEEEKFVSLHGISSVEFARRIRVKQEEEKKKKDDEEEAKFVAAHGMTLAEYVQEEWRKECDQKRRDKDEKERLEEEAFERNIKENPYFDVDEANRVLDGWDLLDDYDDMFDGLRLTLNGDGTMTTSGGETYRLKFVKTEEKVTDDIEKLEKHLKDLKIFKDFPDGLYEDVHAKLTDDDTLVTSNGKKYRLGFIEV